MTDRNFVLKRAHRGLGRNPRHREVIGEEKRAFEAHVAEIEAEQEEKNAALAARKTNPTHLAVAPRYAAERRRRSKVARATPPTAMTSTPSAPH